MSETLLLEHHVAGARVGGTAVVYEQHNPAAPDDLTVQVPGADAALVARAGAAARAAQDVLEDMGVEARGDVLARTARALTAQSERIAVLIARETGKTLADSRGEIGRAIRLFDFFAGETLRNIGERFDSTRRGAVVEVSYGPVGVVGAITPWNFPIAIPAWKLAPALAYGNSVLWKPSEVSSATADALMQCMVEAGLPAGAVNMLLGAGETGRHLVESGDIDAISFTGSVPTGTRIRHAAMTRGLRVQAEMGGVNGLIVMADANLDTAVECAVNGAFFAAGQRCTATSRIIVEESIADAFVARLRQRVEQLKLGDPRDPSVIIGPLANAAQKARIAQQVQDVLASGARLLFGGPDAPQPHAFYTPTLFDAIPEGSPIAEEEIFGPVAGLFRVPDFDAAMRLINATPFGLSAGICTQSLKYAELFKRRVRAGVTMVNLPTAGIDYHAPFGGIGASSYGLREQGRAARTFYTTSKTCYQGIA